MRIKNLWSLITPLCMMLALQGCKDAEAGNCDDGKDNDRNGKIDCADPACSDDPDCVPPEICDDGIDNDSDGNLDCIDAECANFDGCTGGACVTDSDCGGEFNPDCLDEDTTGFPGGYCVADCDPANGDADCDGGICIAFQSESLCFAVCNADLLCRDGYECADLGDGETFACVPDCSDDKQCTVNQFCDTDPNSDTAGLCFDLEDCAITGIDDDLDGFANCTDTDCASDAGCIAAIGDACGGATVANLGANAGDTSDNDNLFASSCGGSGNEEVFVFTPVASGDIDFVLSSAADLGIYVRSTCNDGLTELGCTDDFFGGNDEVLNLDVTAGIPLTLFVDGFEAADSGAYILTITPIVCGDGIVSSTEECDDDDVTNGDGCSNVCTIEDGFSCDNTVDPSVCTDLSDVCNDETTAIADITATTTGDTTDGLNFFKGSCTGVGKELLFSIVPGGANETGVLTIVLTSDSDLGVYVRATCALGGTEIDCIDDAFPGGDNPDTETLRVNITDASDALAIFVDTFVAGQEGPFTMTTVFVADTCGDSQTTGGEGCDDGNTTGGDGCSGACQVENNFVCNNAVSPSICTNLNTTCNAAPSINLGATNGTTSNATALFTPTNNGLVQDCEFSDAGSGAELLFAFTPAADGNLTLTVASTAGADLTVYVRTDCNDASTEIGCADVDFPGQAPDPDIETLTIPVDGGTPLTIFVDTVETNTGAFTLTLQ